MRDNCLPLTLLRLAPGRAIPKNWSGMTAGQINTVWTVKLLINDKIRVLLS